MNAPYTSSSAEHTEPPEAAETLRAALAGLLDGLPPTQAARAVDRLIANYRGTTPTGAPILRDRADVVAYAAYRMPATFEAVASALRALADAAPADWRPGSHLDIGGGTGAAVWAARDAFPEARSTTVLDWSEPALALGRELAAADEELSKSVRWQRARIGAAEPLPGADLVTISYVLKELTEADRAAVVDAAARAATEATGAVAVVEPGTPDGYARIIAARDRLIAAGLRVAAPCPHSATCPIAPGTDWCHFSVRVSRSSLHRRVKGGTLAYEDEKFAYVVATRFEPRPVAARVVRRPQMRKGQVLLDLCEARGALDRVTVTKKHGGLYKEARGVEWGDGWEQPGN
ncbi:small ribosomal subunit Rsm22 family protein [Streptomyces beihaiensis]|uniref:Small ribosomal subunit Rsm22 family protein n=1 Tax=Streptomyces beihaiensis TaxID=2984495 RepID=A0ABT3TT88_9ACTN|nr:small ribosomal subunit Rsm22 family protein [Streptomyces beihaiensis]MCX3059637.1 small ribosomal subunit Rsm22 family protein [Streptomyces beihaiensis]